MAEGESGISRREFLRQGTAAGLGLMMSPPLAGLGWAASRDRVRVLHGLGLDSLHPYNHSSSPLYGLWEHVLEPLVIYDYSTNEWKGRLAESWEFQGKRWVFHLRKGIKFSDGSSFTSKDVAFSMNFAKTDKKSLQRSPFKRVVEIQTPDDYTVVVLTKKPRVTFISRGVRNRYIMSRAAAEKHGMDFSKKPPVGTGPYTLVSFKRDGDTVLRRNDNYWGERPQIRELIWRKVPEEAARVAGLEAGQGDVVDHIPVHEIPRLQRHPRVRVEKVAGLRIYFFGLNPAFKPWDNKLIRQAANYSVDAHSIVKNIFDGNGFVLDGPVASHVIGYDPNWKRYPYDPKKARALLAKGGYKNGVDVKLYFNPARYAKTLEVVQVVKEQMRKGGFRVELVPQEWVVYWGRSGINGGKLPFYYIGRGGVLDADIFWDQYFHTGVTKRLSYSNPEFDALIEKEQGMSDHEERVKVLQQVGRILMDDVPFIPLYHLADTYGVSREIIWKPRPDEEIHVYEMRIRS
ncbi:MAG: ABC transporter substrate-binding protein [Candidatus Binatia bacterium]